MRAIILGMGQGVSGYTAKNQEFVRQMGCELILSTQPERCPSSQDGYIRHAGRKLGEFLAKFVKDREDVYAKHLDAEIKPLRVVHFIKELLSSFAKGIDFRKLYAEDPSLLSFSTAESSAYETICDIQPRWVSK